VDLFVGTDACHSGVFADAVRGAELQDARTVAQQAAGASPGPGALLDAAIAVQVQKDEYIATMRSWWARRYELEVPINAGDTSDPVMGAWQAHYGAARTPWNEFASRQNPLLGRKKTAGAAAGCRLRSLALPVLSRPYDNDAEMRVQANLDDIDTLVNEVLSFAGGLAGGATAR
jgi:hypothetical protein